VLIMLAWTLVACHDRCEVGEADFGHEWALAACDYMVTCAVGPWASVDECVSDQESTFADESARQKECGAEYDGCRAAECLSVWSSAQTSCEGDFYADCDLYSVWEGACLDVAD
jgi:hypothetical protein